MLYIGEYASGGRSRIGQAFEYSLNYQHVVRSSGNRDIHHFRPILPHIVLPSPSPLRCPSKFYASQFCSFRGIVNREIQSAKFLRLSYTLVCQKQINTLAAHIVSTKYLSVRRKRTDRTKMRFEIDN